jgi:HEAT repeat protein
MGERAGRAERGGDAPDDRRGEEADPHRRGDRRRVRGLSSLLLLAIGGAVVYLAWSIHWSRNHPASNAAQRVRQGEAAARLQSIRELERIGPEDPGVALPALAEAMSDAEPGNRAAAIAGVLEVIQHVAPNGSEPEAAEAAILALMGRLEDPQPEIRAKAAEGLGMVVLMWQGAPRVLALDRMASAFVALADDPDTRIRALAVRGLGPIGRKMSEDPPPRLVAALDDPSEEVRTAAARYLAGYRRGLARLLPALAKGVEATRPECRRAYIDILNEIRPKLPDLAPSEDLIPALASALGTRDHAFRAKVLATLGQFRDEARAAIPALISLLGERDEAGSPGPLASPRLADVDAGPRREELPTDPVIMEIDTLGRVAGFNTRSVNQEPVAVPPVQDAVAALKPLLTSADPRHRVAAIDALQSFAPDPALIPTLEEAIADRDASVRVAALGTLGVYGQDLDFPLLEALPRALEDEEPAVRVAAAKALGSLRSGVEPVVPALLRHAQQDPVPEVRGRCEWALAWIRPPAITAAVLPRYLEAIHSPESSGSLRRTLIEILPRFGPAAREAVPALIRALRAPAGKGDGPDPGNQDLLRGSAAAALGELAPGGPHAAEAIAALTHDLDHDLAIPAAEALGKFGPAARSAAPALLRELRRARDRKLAYPVAAFSEAMGRVAAETPEGEEALVILIDYLDKKDNNSPVVFRLITAAGGFGPWAAAILPRLRGLTKSDEPQIREAANQAVAAIEGPGR